MDPLASLLAGAVLRRRAEQRLVNQKQYLEAKRLLKEFRARYQQLMRNSLRSALGGVPPQPSPPRPVLSHSHPKLGQLLDFVDEFSQEPLTGNSKG